jgi:hypothetical protein
MQTLSFSCYICILPADSDCTHRSVTFTPFNFHRHRVTIESIARNLFVCLFTCLYSRVTVQHSVRPSVRLSSQHSVRPSVRLSSQHSVRPSVYLHNILSVRPSIFTTFCPSVRPFIFTTFCPSVRPFIFTTFCTLFLITSYYNNLFFIHISSYTKVFPTISSLNS